MDVWQTRTTSSQEKFEDLEGVMAMVLVYVRYHGDARVGLGEGEATRYIRLHP